MKHLLKKLLPALLCVAMLSVSASALLVVPKAAPAPGPMRVWGALTKLEDGGLQLKNSNKEDPYQEIILHGERMVILDAVSGAPLAMADLKDGETVYAYIGNAVTASLPPQATAKLVLAHIPADFAVPAYYEIAAAVVDGKNTRLTVEGGETVTIPETATFFPYLTKNVVSAANLLPGSHILAWSDMNGAINRVMVFAYGYRGQLAVSDSGEITLNGEKITATARLDPDKTLLPLRAVAEALGYSVKWDPTAGAVVSQGSVTVASVLPGQQIAKTTNHDVGLTTPCVCEKGVTYLAASDLASVLNLYFIR